MILLDEVLQELRNLNEPVPKPLPLPTLEELTEIEQELHIQFHPDYRQYLLKASNVTYEKWPNLATWIKEVWINQG